MAMDSSPSLSSEVGPAEDVIQALLEFLVEPLLPSRGLTHKGPSLTQQQSVAKQMHAVVLLYNYYQRKCHSEVEFLGYESFCKLAVILKPSLMAHMKLMHRSDFSELDDLENQLSLTEKAIMDACDTSLVLDASKDIPETEGWPISKVSVLLIDSRMENCLLLFSSVTHGVWSVIEKDIPPDINSDDTVEAKHNYKRKKIIKKPLRNKQNADEASLQQLAFSAVKEAAGINQADLMVLESHIVYSLSKEKSAARFYIMQCTQSINEDLQFPVKDAIESLQGPLFKKSSCGWTVTPTVEYFQVLPYFGILSDWLSRQVHSNNLQDLGVDLGNVHEDSSNRTENPPVKGVTGDRDTSNSNIGVADSISYKAGSDSSEYPKTYGNGRQMTCLSNSVDGPESMDADDSFMLCPKNQDINKNTQSVIEVYHSQRKMATSANSNKYASESCLRAKGEKFDSMLLSCVTKCSGEKDDTGNKTCNIISSEQEGIPNSSLAPFKMNSNSLENLQVVLASRENALSETALRVLLRKRGNLAHQLRNLKDEIAICDKNIRTILDGGQDDLALQIEAVIDGCNDACPNSKSKIQNGTDGHFEDQGSPQYIKRKRLSEAILTLQDPCQELDDICCRNSWILPTYRVYPSDGGFQARVTVKGMDFEFSGCSDLHSNPREARTSVAAKMIAKLQIMSGKTQ